MIGLRSEGPSPAPVTASKKSEHAAGPSVSDAATAVGLAILTVLTRLPFITTVPYAWDSILYLRAVRDFDVAAGRPHPPGYVFYVMTARALGAVFGDAHAGLVAESVLASGFAVALTYLLGKRLVGRAGGVVAALLLAVSPTFWVYSGVAYPYTVLAAGSLLVVWVFLDRRLIPGAPVLAGTLLGAVGGFRIEVTLFMWPLLLAAIGWRCRHTPRAIPLGAAAAGIGAVLGVGLWLLPTALESGGVAEYLDILVNQADYVGESYSVLSHGLIALAVNLGQVSQFLAEALGPSWIFAVVWFVSPAGGRLLGRWRLSVVTALVWIAPMLVFHALVHIGDRGYTFAYLPAFCIAAGGGVRVVNRAGSVLVRRSSILLRASSTTWFRHLVRLSVRVNHRATGGADLTPRPAPRGHPLPERGSSIVPSLAGEGRGVGSFRGLVGGIRGIVRAARAAMRGSRRSWPPLGRVVAQRLATAAIPVRFDSIRTVQRAHWLPADLEYSSTPADPEGEETGAGQEVGRDVRFRKRVGHAASLLAGLARASVMTLAAGTVLAGFAAWSFFFSVGRMTAADVRCFSPVLVATAEKVREYFPPDRTLIFASFFYQHVQEMLPEYPAWLFDPVGAPRYIWQIPEGIEYLVVFGEDLPVNKQSMTFDVALPCSRRFHYFVVEAGDQLSYVPGMQKAQVQRSVDWLQLRGIP